MLTLATRKKPRGRHSLPDVGLSNALLFDLQLYVLDTQLKSGTMLSADYHLVMNLADQMARGTSGQSL